MINNYEIFECIPFTSVMHLKLLDLYHAADFHKKKELNSAKIRALSDAKKF
jgi:hypothetical protein